MHVSGVTILYRSPSTSRPQLHETNLHGENYGRRKYEQVRYGRRHGRYASNLFKQACARTHRPTGFACPNCTFTRRYNWHRMKASAPTSEIDEVTVSRCVLTHNRYRSQKVESQGDGLYILLSHTSLFLYAACICRDSNATTRT